jgi:hypothetical protein
MAERKYFCVDCGRSHVALIWYVRQTNLIGPLLKTDYLCADAHSRLGPVLQAPVDASRLNRGAEAPR